MLREEEREDWRDGASKHKYKQVCSPVQVGVAPLANVWKPVAQVPTLQVLPVQVVHVSTEASPAYVAVQSENNTPWK